MVYARVLGALQGFEGRGQRIECMPCAWRGFRVIMEARGHHCGIYGPDELIPLTNDCPDAR